MFAEYTIDAITNGVHAATWVSEPFQRLYDRYIPGWKQDNFSFRYALSIPKQEIWNAHTETKKQLIEYVNRETNMGMGVDVLTIGYAEGQRPTKERTSSSLTLGGLKYFIKSRTLPGHLCREGTPSGSRR